MKNGKLQVKKCVYCGGVAEDKDHIPSKNLYKGVTNNINPIKVPSCKKCNSGFSKDEVYFRDLVVGLLLDFSLTARTLFDGTISRSVRKNPLLAKKMFSQMSLVNFYSKEKIFLGKKTAVKIDHKRVFNIMDKYLKGLFFNKFEKVLPQDWVIRHFWITDKSEARIFPFLKKLKWQAIDENVFAFGYYWVPNTFQSIWCSVFFGKPLFYSVVLDPKTAQKQKNEKITN